MIIDYNFIIWSTGICFFIKGYTWYRAKQHKKKIQTILHQYSIIEDKDSSIIPV